MTGVSRSGRVRKKSSKLVDFQSPDDIDTAKTAKRTVQKSPSTRTLNASHRSPVISSINAKSTIKAYFHPIPKQNNNIATNDLMTKSPVNVFTVKKQEPDVIIDAERELDMLLSPGKYLSDDENGMNADNNNDVDSDEDFELTIDTTMRKSAYMSEKSSKKKVLKDGEIVLSRPQRKDKGKPRFTAYMLWSKEIRQEMLKSNPNMDFSQASRRLSSMWAIVPNNEKNIWRRRAKRITIKNKRALKTGDKLTTKYLNRTGHKKPGRKPKNIKDASHEVTTSPTKKTKSDRRSNSSSNTKNDDTTRQRNSMNNNSNMSPILPGAYKVTGTGPNDVAAHLKLLGDNLTIIGQRLKEHEVGWVGILFTATKKFFLNFITI